MALEIEFLVKDRATKQTKQLNKELKGLDGSIIKSDKSSRNLDSSLGSLARNAAVAYASFRTLSGIFDITVTNGLQYNKVIEEQTASIATLISVTSAQEDSLGNLLTTQEKYTLATKEANEALRELEKINANTPNTLGETAKIFKTLLPSMKAVGATTDDLIVLTEKLSIAANAGGVEFNSLLAGVDGLATGTVLANSDLGRFLSSLGLTNKALKESDNVVGLLTDSLSDFKALDTITVATSNLNVEWQKLTGTLTVDIFEANKQGIKALTEEIKGLNASKSDILAIKGAFEETVTFIVNASKFVVQPIAGFAFAIDSLKLIFLNLKDQVSKVFIDIEANILESSIKIQRNIKSVLPEVISTKLDINTESLKAQERELLELRKQSLDIQVRQNERLVEHYDFGIKINNTLESYGKLADTYTKGLSGATKELEKQEKVVSRISGGISTLGQFKLDTKETGSLIPNTDKDKDKLDEFFAGAKKGFEGFKKDAGGAAKLGETAFNSFANSSADALADFATGGKTKFKDFAQSVISDLIRIAARQAVVGIFSGGFGFANGGFLPETPVKNFANGGLLTGGSGTKDDLFMGNVGGSNVMAMGGEFFTQKSSVNPQTRPTLEYINENGRLPQQGQNTQVIQKEETTIINNTFNINALDSSSILQLFNSQEFKRAVEDTITVNIVSGQGVAKSIQGLPR